ncbi:MAG: hypothetical protein KBC95_03135 [Candidatus Peribacteraceae bacterium]|nr:hypothetical protein [Candidatus Peribacteraceae bacterium]
MFSRTSVAFLLPLLMAAFLLAGCTAAVSSRLEAVRQQNSGLIKTAQDLEKKVGETVGRVQSGASLILDGVNQLGSGAAKINAGKAVLIGGSGEVK